MGEEISKKELLEKYSISYGALYRWKRKGLIPDEWFIRKSAPTGQETYFPKALISERVEIILSELHGDASASLDDILKKFNIKQNVKTLVLETEFGTKTIPVAQIKQAYITNGSIREDILKILYITGDNGNE